MKIKGNFRAMFHRFAHGKAKSYKDGDWRVCVVDYLDVKLFNFAVFNFADICVVLGAIFMLIFLFGVYLCTNINRSPSTELELPNQDFVSFGHN